MKKLNKYLSVLRGLTIICLLTMLGFTVNAQDAKDSTQITTENTAPEPAAKKKPIKNTFEPKCDGTYQRNF
jgi:hypothetical protein